MRWETAGCRLARLAGAQLQLGLWNLQRQLAGEATSQLVEESEGRVAAELQQWGERSAEYYRGQDRRIQGNHDHHGAHGGSSEPA
jgi:hypothetical protein